MESNSIIHGLWIGTKLSTLEFLTIQSFLDHGHEFHLWAYDAIENVPNNVVLKDACEIIPRDSVFKYRHTNAYGHGKGSYAGFSDIFRYKLLYEFGGIYVDMDITCLKPFDFQSPYVFRYHHKFGAVGNIMKCPAGAEVMDWCYHQAVEQVNEENIRWELPIEILNQGIRKFDLSDQIISLSNDDSWPLVTKFLSGREIIPNDWYAIHWMNEEWRTLVINKNKFLSLTNISDLLQMHGFGVEYFSGLSSIGSRIRLSRYYYIYRNLVSRLRRII